MMDGITAANRAAPRRGLAEYTGFFLERVSYATKSGIEK